LPVGDSDAPFRLPARVLCDNLTPHRPKRYLSVNEDLQDMLRISTSAGGDQRLVQGGGGNTSVKADGGRLMYVKASGTALGQMREGRGYRLVDVAKCAAIVGDERLRQMPASEREAEVLSRLMDCCVDELEGRPSVETSLHAMLGRCVVHTHPSVVNGLLCAQKGRAVLDELFAQLDPPLLYVDYAGAGYALAYRMADELAAYQRKHGRLPEVIFLENHGLFVSTEDADRALALTGDVFRRIEEAASEAERQARLPEFAPPEPGPEQEAIAEVAACVRRFHAGVFGRPVLVRFQRDEVVAGFLRLPQAADLCGVSPLVPDQVVYCRDRPVWVELPAEPGNIQETVGEALAGAEAAADTPLCVVVAGLGLFCAAPSPSLLEAVCSTMRAVLETLSIASFFGGPRGLDDESLAFLRGWEVERFRRGLATGPELEEDLAGRVALVTGAGSGLGRGISLCLARKGVHVILADIDVGHSEETADQIASAESPGSGHPVHADVTSEESVRGLFDRSIRRLGGVDILVNCAGIAPAHPLTEFPLAAWQKALDINLTGYFLVAREAARCMIRQGTGGSIINISSKTGLEASKHHTAYNATKAAEIHMARGWALDLAEHSIRVNCICPGNVFQGSKLWTDEYINALARKRGLKPEEVIPYYIGLTALKQEITPDDVGEAVVFLAGSKASKITGQTLVVDAGQVFVR